MKVERKETEKPFIPVTLTLESQKELDFLFGLLNTGSNALKKDSSSYIQEMDKKMFNLLYKFK